MRFCFGDHQWVVCWLSSETRQINELMGLRHAKLGKGETLLGTIKLTCRSDGHGWLILNVTVRLAISIGQVELQAYAQPVWFSKHQTQATF
jgi:hypothetical protein